MRSIVEIEFIKNVSLFKGVSKKYSQLGVFNNIFQESQLFYHFFLQNVKKWEVPNLAR